MLHVNVSRLLKNLEGLGQIGRTPAGGVSRPALSKADVAGREWFRRKIVEAGLQFKIDGAGNMSAILPSSNLKANTLLSGSHLDTVTNGGRYDGSLGVLCALEALQTVKEASLNLPVHLEAINFTDEESTLFSELGSKAFTGQLTKESLKHTRDAEQLEAGLHRLALSKTGVLAAQRNPHRIVGFVEVHIEQGKQLEDKEQHIGVVTSIVGIRSYWVTFRGRAGHSGTTPMDQRADAMRGAAEFVVQAQTLVTDQYVPGVINFGQIELAPGNFNIIPAQARLALEFRHGTEAQLDQMQADLLALADQIGQIHGLSVSSRPVGNSIAAKMDERMMCAIEAASTKLGLRHTRLLSFAGHDAQNLCRFVPTAMIFVPSVGGISHHPSEFTHNEDVVNGANVLLHTLLSLNFTH